jgi:hypothetical protein
MESTMKTDFRPIPVTILDFLGVLLPGWVWLFLISATIDFIFTGGATPGSAWIRIGSIQSQGGTWLGPLAAIFSALIVGYSLKPISMLIAQRLSKVFFKFSSNTRTYAGRDMVFPFTAYFSSKTYYPKVNSILMRVCGIETETALPGKAPFSPAKRYLRLLSPILWEESERMEAEVRMIGGFLLASVYTNLLSCMVVLMSIAKTQALPHISEWLWIVITFVATFLLGIGFNRTRLHEVEYTYMNMLLAEGYRIESKDKKKD